MFIGLMYVHITGIWTHHATYWALQNEHNKYTLSVCFGLCMGILWPVSMLSYYVLKSEGKI